jgi:general stress protein 26
VFFLKNAGEVGLLLAAQVEADLAHRLGGAHQQALWSPFAKVWVPDGVKDPDLRVLKVTPRKGITGTPRTARSPLP